MARVMIWRPKMKLPDSKRAPRSTTDAAAKAESMIENVGHAALLCDQTSSSSYISFWPDRQVSLGEPSSPSFATPSYRSDVEAEGGGPDVSIDLSCLEDSLIDSWWVGLTHNKGYPGPYALEYLPESDYYDLWRTNCSSIVALAMKIGGAEKFVPIPKIDTVTPMHIEGWARTIAVAAGLSQFYTEAVKRMGW